MNGFAALLKKEFTEQWRTKRLIIVSAVFLFFGLLSPVMTKYLPELIELAGEGGMVIEIPTPTAVQAMAEYISSMLQFGILIAVLVAMGTIARERESGIAAMVLSKPVGFLAYIMAKLTALGSTFVAAILIGGLAAWGYTLLLFGEAPVAGFVAYNLLLLLYLALAIAFTLLFSSIFRSQLAAGALGLVSIIVLSLLSALPWVGKYLPGQLITWGNELLMGQSATSAWGAVAVTVALIALVIYLTWRSLRSKEL